MKKVYLLLDSDNRVEGYSSASWNENEIELDLPDEHELFTSFFRTFIYQDGTLIKDFIYEVKLAKKRKFQELNKICNQEILGYFEATVNSVAYLFSFDQDAQQNFNGALSFFSEGLIPSVEWTAHLDGKAVRITLDKAQFLSVVHAAFTHKNNKIHHLRNVKVPEIDAISDTDPEVLDKIGAIIW